MERKMYQVVEIGKGIRETYMMMATEKEISEYLNNKNEMYGYNPGCGGDKTYSAVAWETGKEGQYIVDLESIWNLYRTKVA